MRTLRPERVIVIGDFVGCAVYVACVDLVNTPTKQVRRNHQHLNLVPNQSPTARGSNSIPSLTARTGSLYKRPSVGAHCHALNGILAHCCAASMASLPLKQHQSSLSHSLWHPCSLSCCFSGILACCHKYQILTIVTMPG